MTYAWLTIAFFVCLAAVGVPFWMTPYGDLNVPDVFLLPALLVVLPVAAGLRLAAIARSAIIVAVLTGAMLLANIIRIQVDTGADPTSHNLFPFELALTMIVGGTIAAAGSILGKLAGILFTRFGGGGNRE